MIYKIVAMGKTFEVETDEHDGIDICEVTTEDCILDLITDRAYQQIENEVIARSADSAA